MSKMEIQKVINNNSINPLSPISVDPSGCSKLVPSKLTFLKSNQIVTKYVQEGNVRSNPITEMTNKNTNFMAYDTCETQKQINEERKRKIQVKAEQAQNKAKKSNEVYQLQIIKNKKELQQKAKEIELMIEGTYSKAADIMLGRNNSLFARKQKDDSIPLKEMKEHTCDKSLKKIEATRKAMTNKSYQILKTLPLNREKEQQISALYQSFSNGSSSSLLQSTKVSNHKMKEKAEKRENKLKNLLNTYSFENLYDAKRRHAAIQGFGMYWQMGNTVKKVGRLNLFKQSNKKQRVTKKAKWVEYKDSFDEIFNSDNCEFLANKRYSTAFVDHVQKYTLSITTPK